MTWKLLEKRKTNDGILKVIDEDDTRWLYINHAMESAVYIRSEERSTPVFDYLKILLGYMKENPGLHSVLLIGSGGFSLPQALVRQCPSMTVYAAEYDTDVIDISRKYFGLDTLEENPRFHLIQGDGFAWLKNSDLRFDMIINDAFRGTKAQGLNDKDIQMTAEHLNEKGLYVINAVIPLRSIFHTREKLVKRLNHTFRETDLILCDEDAVAIQKQNCLLVCRKNEVE